MGAMLLVHFLLRIMDYTGGLLQTYGRIYDPVTPSSRSIPLGGKISHN
jgi:hypothetical protein